MSLYEISKKVFTVQFLLIAIVVVVGTAATAEERLLAYAVGGLFFLLWAMCGFVFPERNWSFQEKTRWTIKKTINADRDLMREEGLFLDLNSPENLTEWFPLYGKEPASILFFGIRVSGIELYVNRKERLIRFGNRSLEKPEVDTIKIAMKSNIDHG